MSDLLLMSPPGLPRTGLVGLWDPYRDAYGRNVSVLSTGSMYKYMLTLSEGVFYETTDESMHVAKPVQVTTAGLTYSAEFRLTPVGGRKRFMLYIGWASAVFDVTTCALVGSSGFTGTPVIDSFGGGQFAVRGVATALGTSGVYLATMPDDATSYADRNFAGDTSKGFTLNQWQVNLGPVLHPYSAPAGAPGTLQAMADYCGGLYPLQLGSGATGDASDPAFTGVSMLHAADYLLSGNLSGLTMAGDWTLPFLCKPSGTANTLVSLASAAAADQYQAIEYNGSTKVRIHTVNGATNTTSDDLTVSNSTVQLLILTSSGDTLTLKNMATGASVTATNADPTGTPRLCIGALGASTVASPADAIEWYELPLYNRAWTAQEQARAYIYLKSLFARRGVTVA